MPAIMHNEGAGNINFVWGAGGVGYGFPTDIFSARWVRNVHFESGYYRFHAVVDDGGRLWVNNNQVIDKWINQSATEYVTPELELETSEIPIRFEYYENGGLAIAKMWWENLSVSKSGSGSGTVTSSPPGINCGLTCSALFNNNTNVTLTAVARTCSTFTGWSGDCSGTGLCNVDDTSSAISVTANFSLDACRIYLPLVIH